MVTLLEDFLANFEWAEVALTPTIRSAALTFMAQHNLGAQDSVHLASAGLEHVADFASFDRGYRRVNGLHLWNDTIHGA